MKISAELILASKNAATADVLTTLVLTYPRPILAEVNTHRAFSRNTSSTRAIPAKKMREVVWDEPFIPQFIGQNQKGMQAGQEIRGWRRSAAESVFRYGRYVAIFENWLLEKLGVHKQCSGRLLEPWMWVRQVVTATDWSNFLLLRMDKAAEPHMRELARCINFQLNQVKAHLLTGEKYGRQFREDVQVLRDGEWHIPFLYLDEIGLSIDAKLGLSAARCARASYTVTGRRPSERCADYALADRLLRDRHLSPFEHQAQAMNDFRYYANFKSFQQHRKQIDGEDGGDRATRLYNQASEVAG